MENYRENIIELLGNKCNNCHESDKTVLQIDHMFGHAPKKHNFSSGFRCRNCNVEKDCLKKAQKKGDHSLDFCLGLH